MSDLSAWKDRKREAEEYEQAASNAAEAGNFEEAVKLADKAKNAYADLNKEVKSGDSILVSQQQGLTTAMTGVKRSGELAIEILNKQKQAAKDAAAALDEQSGGALSESLKEAEKSFDGLNDSVVDLGDNFREEVISMGEEFAKELDEMERNFKAFAGKNRVVSVTVKEVAAKSTGGLIHKLATGGRLSGYGGGDRIPALLEAGEFVIRKEAVRKFGAGIFNALNSLKLPTIPRFAAGGAVGAAGGTSNTYHLSVNFPGEVSAASRQNAKGVAQAVLKELKEAQRRAS